MNSLLNMGWLAIKIIFNKVALFQYSNGRWGSWIQTNAKMITSLIGKKSSDIFSWKEVHQPLLNGENLTTNSLGMVCKTESLISLKKN